VEKVKAFVDDYNKLLSSITDKLSEESYRDYKPLSDDEKEAMSDDEIKLWTEKAKSGILRNDVYLQSIATELRSSMYTAVNDLGGSQTLGVLADIGISTGVYSEKGQLHLDENKLRASLGSDAEKTLGILAQKSTVNYSVYSSAEQQAQRTSESGVFFRISDVLSKNLNTVGKKGALITLVGSPNNEYKGQTEYSKRIADTQSRIDRMADQLSSEENRYWDQFTAMETAMSKLNSQSSWITSMLGQN
jgi:flagellar hook-associated protein 2